MQEAHVPSKVGKIPWMMAWQPLPIFLTAESHGQKNLANHRVSELVITGGTGHKPTQCINIKDIFFVSPDSPSGLPFFLQINYRLAVSQSQEASSLEWAIRAVCSLAFSQSEKCICSDSAYLVRGSRKQQSRG